MRFSVKAGSFSAASAAEERRAAKAITGVMRDATVGLKEDLRDDVRRAGLGARLANTWRGQAYPRTGDSLNAAAYVFSRAPKLIDAYDRGVTIRSKEGFFLAIPTEFAGKGLRGGKITPGEWEKRSGQRLRFVYRRGAPSLLVAERRARTGKAASNPARRFATPSARTLSALATVVVFILVPQVRVRKRLDLVGTSRRWADIVADRIPGALNGP